MKSFVKTNKSGLVYTSTKDMSFSDWLDFRSCGIGASEVGTILGLSPYKSKVELFYEKISPRKDYELGNVAAFMGNALENFIADLWEYWEDDQFTMMQNHREGNKVRKMQNVNAYIQNPKYPHLFVSLDRRINKHDKKGNGCLELKTIGGWESNKWESGIPPSYIAQVNTQMLVTGWKYSELAVLRDGRFLDVYPLEPHKGITKAIIEQTKDFWKRVEKARILLTQKFEAEKNFNQRKMNEIDAELQIIEPDADNSESLKVFLNDKYKDIEPKAERSGTLQELDYAIGYNDKKNALNELKKDILFFENNLKTSMQNFERITFGEKGVVNWKGDENGNRRFSVRLK